MKQRGKYIAGLAAGIFLVFGCFLFWRHLEREPLPGLFASRETAQDREKSSWQLSFTRGNIHMELAFGRENWIRYGRYMQLKADVENQGKAFSGILQVSLPVGGETRVYQRTFEAADAGSDEVVLYFPARMDGDWVWLTVKDQGGEEIYSRKVSLDPDYGEAFTYIGVCSDQPDQLKYLERVGTRVCYFTAEELPQDFRGLDLLDVLVISDADLEGADLRRIQAITMWVKRGGTLVLADSGEEQELKPFAGELFEWTKKGSSTIRTSLGLDKSDIRLVRQRLIRQREKEKANELKRFLKENLPEELYEKWSGEIEHLEEDSSCLKNGGEIYTYLSGRYSGELLQDVLSLSLTRMERRAAVGEVKISKVTKKLDYLYTDNSQSIVRTPEQIPILQKKIIGMGNLILSGISLSLDSKYWDVLGQELNERIENNLSAHKKRQLARERNKDFTAAENIYLQGLKITEPGRLPNLKFYTVLLVIYVLLIGPAAWFFLLRKKCLIWLWGLIPVTALVFCVLLYLIGTSTRIAEPYINYLSQLQLDEDGQGIAETWFRVVNDSAGEYEAEVKGEPVWEALDLPEEEQSGRRSAEQAEEKSVSYLLCQEEESTRLQIDKLPSFAGVNLKAERPVQLSGNLAADIVSNEMQLGGNITNHLEVTLEDCILYHNGTVYPMGTIKPGRTVMLGLLRKYEIPLDREKDYSFRELAQLLSGGDSLSSDTVGECLRQRRAALLEAYLHNADSAGTFFYGFVAEGELLGEGARSSERDRIDLGGLEQLDYNRYGTTGIVMELEVKGNSAGVGQ